MSRLKKKRRGEVTFNEHDKLVLFLKRMAELTSRTYYKRINWQISSEKVSINEVEEELFAAFILTFRHLYAPSSPTALNTVHSILAAAARATNDSDTINELRRLKEEFDKSPRIILAPYDVNGKSLKCIKDDEMFDLYLNCCYFHTDPRGAQFFFRMPEPHRTKCHQAFQLSLYRYVRRLHGYVPLVAKYLNSPVLPKGGFSVVVFGSGEAAQGTETFTIPKANP